MRLPFPFGPSARRLLRGSALAVSLGSLVACEPYESAHMEPGVDCMSCHVDSTFRWTVAGTVFGRPDAEPHEGVGGTEVVLTDAEGRTLLLRTNSSGNFFTREELVFPIDVELRRDGRSVRMETPTATGSCNGCHNVPALSNAPGRIYAP